MLKTIANFFYPMTNKRMLASYRRKADAINALEKEMASLSDGQMAARTVEFRRRLANGEKLDNLLVPAFATVREAARRVIGQRPYDVQLIGGMVLHDRAIAEMRTGEGKTLVATLPTYLNALAGKGVHIVTVNDYLARRDAETMGRIHDFLGLTVGLIVPDLDFETRRAAYAADVTYATNSELGFDHLRDNLETSRTRMTQRGFHYAIVDEVDSILIDEARTPLILSGPLEDRSRDYLLVDRFIPRIKAGEFSIDEKLRSVHLTDAGIEHAETMLRGFGVLREGHLYDSHNSNLFHHVTAALRAHKLFERDRHYIVKDGEVLIVDEFTGRSMPGRRFNEGLHQALEAKERVAILPENETVAAVTYQNFFRAYEGLAGMTGTATTEAEEFGNIYGLPVIQVPTHKPVVRKDEDDEVYRTMKDKLGAIAHEIDDAHMRLQPVLVGTTSIEKSEEIARTLVAAGYTQIDHADTGQLGRVVDLALAGTPSRSFSVLNARHFALEASIIAQAGLPGAITVATNMAGRGTDIQLGGDPIALREHFTARNMSANGIDASIAELQRMGVATGGLYVIGTERHESRRIDNQLRGRSGRQGDPGRSKFFLSAEDDLLRIFGGISKLVDEIDPHPGEAISHPIVTKAVERSQKKLEAHYFDQRKDVVQYDDVVNLQRLAVLAERGRILDAGNLRDIVDTMRDQFIDNTLDTYVPPKSYPEQWNVEGLTKAIKLGLWLDLPIATWAVEEGIAPAELELRIKQAANTFYGERIATIGDQAAHNAEMEFLLRILDSVWKDHVADLDHLKQAVVWRTVGGMDPLIEFRTDAAAQFDAMLLHWHELVTYELNRPLQIAQVA